MDAITSYISVHPIALVIGVVLIIVLFLHFTLKSLVKLVLIILFIFLAVFGYYHFKEKDTMIDETTGSKEMVQSAIDDVRDKSKSFSRDMKDLYRKSKAAPKEVDKLLDASDKQMDKELKRKK
jgi:hypothetical protein